MRIGINQDPFIKPGSTFESMIESVGDLGLDFFEICPEYVELSFEVLTRKRRADGLEFAKSYEVGFTIHAPWCEPLSTISSVNEGIRKESVRQIRESLKLARDLEASVVTVHGGAESFMSLWYPGQAWKNMVTSLKEVLDVASDLGVDLCVENLPVSYGAFAQLGLSFFLTSPDEFSRLFEEASHERFKITFDFGHANVGHGNIDYFIDHLGTAFGCLHIHDNDRSSDQHLPVGCGSIDYPRYLRRLVAMGYRGPYILEHRSVDHLRTSIKALKRIESTL